MKIAIRDHRGKYGGTWDGPGLVFDRDAIGLGETFDVIVLDAPEPTPTPGPTPPAPPPPGPTPAMNAAYVGAVKAQLEAQGVNLLGPCGAFQITKRVAWGLRARGAGLLSKPGGNNCDGYATDIVAWPDRAYDILSDGGNTNGPNWNETDVEDLAGRWRPAVQP